MARRRLFIEILLGPQLMSAHHFAVVEVKMTMVLEESSFFPARPEPANMSVSGFGKPIISGAISPPLIIAPSLGQFRLRRPCKKLFRLVSRAFNLATPGNRSLGIQQRVVGFRRSRIGADVVRIEMEHTSKRVSHAARPGSRSPHPPHDHQWQGRSCSGLPLPLCHSPCPLHVENFESWNVVVPGRDVRG